MSGYLYSCAICAGITLPGFAGSERRDKERTLATTHTSSRFWATDAQKWRMLINSQQLEIVLLVVASRKRSGEWSYSSRVRRLLLVFVG
jgi:hypothetical protein